MLLRTDSPTEAESLCSDFRRSGFSAQPVGGSMLEVSRPDAPSGEQERREVEVHLRVWRAANPESTAEIAEH
jgi:hypothetical protein